MSDSDYDEIETRFRQQWKDLLEAEEGARRILYGLENRTGTNELREASRNWWSEAERVLDYYAKGLASEMKREWLEPPPLALLWALRGTVGYLATGRTPKTIEAVAGPGTPRAGPTERRDIGWATAFIQMARSGSIVNRRPIQTVMSAYGVARTTARSWADLPLTEDAAAYLGDPEVVEQEMLRSGRNYAKAGRSTGAIQGRGNAARRK